MKSSRSKGNDLNTLTVDENLPRGNDSSSSSKTSNAFSSFFSRSRRNNPPLASLDNILPTGETVKNATAKSRRNSLSSRQYKSMSRSMSDLGAMLTRAENIGGISSGNEAQEASNPPSSPTSKAMVGMSVSSPSKHSPSKKKDLLPFPEETIVKQGWLNKKGAKKEQTMKLHRVYLRASKLYVYKPPADLFVRAFDIGVDGVLRPGVENVVRKPSGKDSLHPADFDDDVRTSLYDFESTEPLPRFKHVHAVKELTQVEAAADPLLALVTAECLILCQSKAFDATAEKVQSIFTTLYKWKLESRIELLSCQIELSKTDSDSATNVMQVQIGSLRRSFESLEETGIASMVSLCTTLQSSLRQQARPSTAPHQITTYRDVQNADDMVDELFSVRQIVRNENGKIIHGTLIGLCRQILLEKIPVKESSSLSSLLLLTMGLWSDTRTIIQELCVQLDALAETATRGRAVQILEFLLEKAPSLLLDSANVECLLKLVEFTEKDLRTSLRDRLWDCRTRLLTVITMDLSHQSSPASHKSETSWNMEFQSLAIDGLYPESILAIPANLFAEQLHIFHRYYLKRWNPARDEALFFNTHSKGASRNPLVFGPHRMHFLTSTILNHVLNLDSPLIQTTQRAAICTQWILVGMMLKRMGDMAGWLAIVMAVCAPAIIRLKHMWTLIETRLQIIVEKEWSPVMRDLFRRTVSTIGTEPLNAHVLAPDADGLSLAPTDVVPFYGDLCDAIEMSRSRLTKSSASLECLDIEVLEHVRDLLENALESYESFVKDDANTSATMDDDGLVVPAIQDCFKQLNSMPLEVLDVCAPTLLRASFRCEQPRVDGMAPTKQFGEYSPGTSSYMPLIFSDLLPSYRLFEVAVLLDINEMTKRPKLNTSSSTSGKSGSAAGQLRRLNSFPPTRRPISYTTGHDHLDTSTRTKAAASVSQWKMLRHVKDLAGVSDRLITFKTANLILKDADATSATGVRRRPQSVLVETRNRDSTVSRRSSVQFGEHIVLEQDDDLVIKPQKVVPRRPGMRELAVKAGTLEMLIDLLILNFSDLRGLQVEIGHEEHSTTSTITIDRPEYLKMFLTSYRAFCTSAELMGALQERLSKANGVSSMSKELFPYWSTAPVNQAPCDETDWILLEKVYTGVFEVVSIWLNIAPADFTSSDELVRLLEQFLRSSEFQIEQLGLHTHVNASASICRDICASNLHRIKKQVLRVSHRPLSWKISGQMHESELDIYDPFSLSRVITIVDSCEALRQLDSIVENVLSCITLDDWMSSFELLEHQTLDPKGFFPSTSDVSMFDQDTEIHDVLWLLQDVQAYGSSQMLAEHLPFPIKKLIEIRKSITIWTIQQVTDPNVPNDARVSRIQTLLEMIRISCVHMSALDIRVTTEGVSSTQIVPSFIATAISAGLVSPQSRVFSYAWHLVALGRGRQDASGSLFDLLPDIDVPEPHVPVVPCLAWLFDRMLEVVCYIPDKSLEDARLLNFDKRRYIYNLLSNLDVVSNPGASSNALDEVDNPFMFILAPPTSRFDWKTLRSAAYRENQTARNSRLCRPFTSLVSSENDKFRRDMKVHDAIDRHVREVKRSVARKHSEDNKSSETSRRPTTKSRYGMNSLLRAVRPISVAISSNWTPDKPAGLSRIVHPNELPSNCAIAKGVKPALTIDLVHSTARISDQKQHIFRIRTEDGMETDFQATTADELLDWVNNLTTAAVIGAKKRRTIIREDARLAAIEEAPQFSPRNSMVVDIVSAMFAVDLTTLVRREGSSIPRIASILMDEVERRGLQEVGIYRISGSHNTVIALKAAFNSGRPVDFTENNWHDINAIAGVFKLWLRELPEPLMTYKLYDRFLGTLDIEDYNAKSLSLKELVHELPVPNFSLLKRLIEHLQKITDYEATNHMYAHNLAIIFGPNILQPVPSEVSFASSMSDLGRVQTIIRNIILQCHWIFSIDESEETLSPAALSTTQILASIRETDSDDQEPT